MQKSMQNKLIAICIILGTILISLIGYIYINDISKLSDVIYDNFISHFC